MYLDQIINFLHRWGPSSLSVVAGARNRPEGADNPTRPLNHYCAICGLKHMSCVDLTRRLLYGMRVALARF